MKRGTFMYYITDEDTGEYFDNTKKWNDKTKDPLFFQTKDEANKIFTKYIKVRNVFEKRNIAIKKIRVIQGVYVFRGTMTHVLEKFIILEQENGVFLVSEPINSSEKSANGFYEGDFQYRKREFKKEKIFVIS